MIIRIRNVILISHNHVLTVQAAATCLLLVSTTVFLIFLLEAASDSAADIASAAIWEADLEYRDL